jgi:hypothetical protein
MEKTEKKGNKKAHELAKIHIMFSQAQAQAMQFQPIFRQYQRLAANKVLQRNDKNPFPYGEGTAASIIRKMPQRVLKQVPSGKMRNISDEFHAVVNEFIIEEIFMRNFCRTNGFIQSLWSLMEAGMTFGWKTITTHFAKINEAYTVDFRMHHWADVYPAVGATNMNDSDVFIVDWWQKEDVKALLKGNDPTIDKEALKILLHSDKMSRPTENQSEENKQAAVNNLGYKVIRAYIKKGGKFWLYIFQEDSGHIIQKKELPSRGHVTFYYSPDFQTAFGRSVLGLIGGIQIDMDNAMYDKRKAQELDMNPMLVVKGIPLSKVQVRPGTMLQLPETGDVAPFMLNTPSLDRYTSDHQMQQSLQFQLAGYPEANVDGDVSGSRAIGKTPAAIKQAQGNIDNADNQVSENLKLFLEQLLIECLKIYYHNMPAQFLIELSAEYSQKLMAIAPERFVQESVVLVDNDLDVFDYEIDIESAKSSVDQNKLDSIMKMLGLLEQSPMLSQRVAMLGIADDLIKEVIFASGLNNDSIAKKLSFLSDPNMMGQPNGDPMGGQPIPMDIAAQMAGNGAQTGAGGINPQPANPIRQQGVM